jgi:hypothetical protein
MTTPADVLACVREALTAINAPRFFETERGFQGELLVQLAQRLPLSSQEILEQEYQKRLREHGLCRRPDIIIHEPFDAARHASRTEGNCAVLELKLNATPASAVEDFQSLGEMIQILHYPLGLFVNIGSTTTYAELVPESARDRVVAYGVALVDGKTQVVEKRTYEAFADSKKTSL